MTLDNENLFFIYLDFKLYADFFPFRLISCNKELLFKLLIFDKKVCKYLIKFLTEKIKSKILFFYLQKLIICRKFFLNIE